MEGTHEVGWRPFMPASTLSGRSVALLRVQLDNCTPSEGQLILTETAQEPKKGMSYQRSTRWTMYLFLLVLLDGLPPSTVLHD
jgi:hypothetical protein